MKNSAFLILTLAVFSLAGCNGNPFVDCGKLTKAERESEPCCSGAYSCSADPVKDPGGEMGARVEGTGAPQGAERVSVLPGFMLKKGKDNTTKYRDYPKGTLFRRIDVQVLSQPELKPYSCIEPIRDAKGTLVDHVDRLDRGIQAESGDGIVTYLHRGSSNVFDLYALSSQGVLDLVENWSQNPGEKPTMTLDCGKDSDVTLREIQRGVRSLVYLDHQITGADSTKITVIALDKNDDLHLLKSDGRMMSVVPSVVNFVIDRNAGNTTFRFDGEPVLGVVTTLDMRPYVLDLEGTPHPDHSVWVENNAASYARTHFPGMAMIKGGM